ncbi:MAG: hypothetical protein KC636_00760, partial [Myxococcales bacterium]|nr:hypothetical protein [Myxococcales bacterium]
EPLADAGAPGPASELPHDRPPAASPHAAHAAAVALSQRSFDPARPIPGTYETPPAPVGPTKPLEPRVDVDALVRQVERRLARELRWERELRRVSR